MGLYVRDGCGPKIRPCPVTKSHNNLDLTMQNFGCRLIGRNAEGLVILGSVRRVVKIGGVGIRFCRVFMGQQGLVSTRTRDVEE